MTACWQGDAGRTVTVFALDLDGTLIDCRPRQVELTSAILAELGAPPVDRDALWASKREGATTREALLAAGIPAHVVETAVSRWVARIEDPTWLSRDPVLAETPRALAAVRSVGMSPVVLTARRDSTAVRDQVARLDLDVDEVDVVDPSDSMAAKADRLRALGAVAYVGDTEADARAAAAASVLFAAVGGGQRSERFLRAEGVADVRADVFAAVTTLLARIAAG